MKFIRRFQNFIALTILALGLLSPVGPTGCSSTLSPTGVYQGDKILYNADVTITTAYKSFDSFLKWETAFRAVLPVEVSRAADTIRLNAKKWIDSASALREAYASNPTRENRDKLKATLDLIDTALVQAQKYMTRHTKPTNA